MSLAVQTLPRYFSFNGLNLPDPGPSFSPEEVKDTFATAYPDLLTAVIETEVGDTSITYKFIRSVGTKG